MPRKELIEDMAEVARGSESEGRSVAETETSSEFHFQFFIDHSEDTTDVTPYNRRSTSPSAGRRSDARQTCTGSEMSLVVSDCLYVDIKIVWRRGESWRQTTPRHERPSGQPHDLQKMVVRQVEEEKTGQSRQTQTRSRSQGLVPQGSSTPYRYMQRTGRERAQMEV